MSVIAETSLTKHTKQFAHTLKRGAPLFSDGFERCGIVYVRGGEERIAFQKVARS